MSKSIIDWHSHCDDDGILWLTLDMQKYRYQCIVGSGT